MNLERLERFNKRFIKIEKLLLNMRIMKIGFPLI